jgi:hypothetical protein
MATLTGSRGPDLLYRADSLPVPHRRCGLPARRFCVLAAGCCQISAREHPGGLVADLSRPATSGALSHAAREMVLPSRVNRASVNRSLFSAPPLALRSPCKPLSQARVRRAASEGLFWYPTREHLQHAQRMPGNEIVDAAADGRTLSLRTL